jgi:hypothetical protein
MYFVSAGKMTLWTGIRARLLTCRVEVPIIFFEILPRTVNEDVRCTRHSIYAGGSQILAAYDDGPAFKSPQINFLLLID